MDDLDKVKKHHTDSEREGSHREPVTKHDLEKLKEIIMSVLSDLQAAVATLQTASANENSAVLAAIADINSLPASDAQLVPLTTAINAVAVATQANADKLNAAVGAVIAPPALSPTIAVISPVAISLAAAPGLASVGLSGISSTAPAPSISVSVVSSDNGAVISPPSVSYTSPNTTGSLTFTPVTVGTATVTVTVNDGVGTAAQTFVVTVSA